jgi:hypothetical protein
VSDDGEGGGGNMYPLKRVEKLGQKNAIKHHFLTKNPCTSLKEFENVCASFFVFKWNENIFEKSLD